MFTAQDGQTIRAAFAQAKPNTDYARLPAAAVARRQADQIYIDIHLMCSGRFWSWTMSRNAQVAALLTVSTEKQIRRCS